MHEWDLPVDGRGLALRVCEWGPAGETPASGPPVLVLHGFLEQGAAWDRVARLLARERRVVAPDQRGHGRSGHVGAGGWYHFWDYVGDVDVLVAHLGGTVDLVGHSMGATVAALFAGARPDAVRRLVLVDGLGPPDGAADAVARVRAYLDGRRSPPTQPVLPDVDAAAERIRRFNGVDLELARALAARITEPAEGGVRWTWDPLHRGRMPTPFDVRLFTRFLAEIRAPVLAVDGGRSPFVLPDRQERAAHVRDLRRVVLDAGHLVHHEAPSALAEAIGAFLGEGA